MDLIQSAFGAALEGAIPREIVYIPDGEHTITPSVNGRPKTVTVRIPAGRGAQVAAALQASLAKRLSDNVKPHLAFDHKPGPAAGHPEGFRYEAGRGILLKLSWSASGKDAIEGRNYGYFSPAFLVDAQGVPAGLPDAGEVGSLVNNPAFRTIPAVLACSYEEPEEDHRSPHDMLAAAIADELGEGASRLAAASAAAEKRIDAEGLTGTEAVAAAISAELEASLS